jgi:hypothetical protein
VNFYKGPLLTYPGKHQKAQIKSLLRLIWAFFEGNRFVREGGIIEREGKEEITFTQI